MTTVLWAVLALAIALLLLMRARRSGARGDTRAVPELRASKPAVPRKPAVPPLSATREPPSGHAVPPLSATPPGTAPPSATVPAAPKAEPSLGAVAAPSSPAETIPFISATPPAAGPSPSLPPLVPEASTPSERLRSVAATPAATQTEAAQEVGADFYDEIAKLLLAELEKNPSRRDLRYKLMEVYASGERREPFVEQTRLYISGLGGRADSYWPRIIAMGRELAPETGFYTEQPPLSLTPPAAPARVTPVQRARRFYDSVNQVLLSSVQLELQEAYKTQRQDLGFWKAVQSLCEPHIAAASSLAAAPQLSAYLGGARLYFKNERQRPLADAAKISAVGQVVLAQRMGRRRIVAGGMEDGHGFAIAAAARQLGLQCTLHIHEQEQQLFRDEIAQVEMLGARLKLVRDTVLGIGASTQAQALADSLDDREHAFWISPLAAGPHPYPMIVRDLQGLSGRNLRAQIVKQTGRMPDALIVSTADGMHAVGLLQPFLKSSVRLHCVEAAQDQSRSSRERFTREHSWLRATERVRYGGVAPEVARFAAAQCLPDGWSRLHESGGEVLAEAFGIARALTPEQIVVVVIPYDSEAQAQPLEQASAA